MGGEGGGGGDELWRFFCPLTYNGENGIYCYLTAGTLTEFYGCGTYYCEVPCTVMSRVLTS